jgi:hypothetical protein
MLRRVAFLRADVSEKLIASIIRVERIIPGGSILHLSARLIELDSIFSRTVASIVVTRGTQLIPRYFDTLGVK